MVLAGYQRHLGENVKTDYERCFEDLDDWKAQLSTFRVVTLEQSGRKLPPDESAAAPPRSVSLKSPFIPSTKMGLPLSAFRKVVLSCQTPSATIDSRHPRRSICRITSSTT